MRTTELKGYGVTGVKAEFSLMDCYETTFLIDRIKSVREQWNKVHEFTADMVQEVITIMVMSETFFEKIALKPSEMSTMFLPKEDENDEKEC